MKRIIALLLVAFVLTGCAGAATYETISDGLETPREPAKLQMTARMPQSTSKAVLSHSTAGDFYEYADGTITMQAMAAGDFTGMIREVTGYPVDGLQIMESIQSDLKSFQTVWTSAGEGQTLVGRACILTEGNYYYVLTAMVPENKAASLWEGELKEMFASFRAVPKDEIISSGS